MGQGRALADILAERRAVTEGVHSASAVVDLARKLGVDMPICEAVNALLHDGAHLDQIIASLLARPLKSEL